MAFPYSIFNTRSATDPGAPARDFFAVSGTPTVYSEVWSGDESDGYGLTVFTTGTLTGTFTLWMTDKITPSLADDTDWVQDTTFVPTNPAGAAVKYRDDGGNAKAKWKRLKYISASGAGNLQGWVSVPKFRG